MQTNADKPKGKFQKISQVSAAFSFLFMFISGYFLYKDGQELGMSDPITASWLAGFFFFFFMGFALNLLAKANLPSFKFED